MSKKQRNPEKNSRNVAATPVLKGNLVVEAFRSIAAWSRRRRDKWKIYLQVTKQYFRDPNTAVLEKRMNDEEGAELTAAVQFLVKTFIVLILASIATRLLDLNTPIEWFSLEDGGLAKDLFRKSLTVFVCVAMGFFMACGTWLIVQENFFFIFLKALYAAGIGALVYILCNFIYSIVITIGGWKNIDGARDIWSNGIYVLTFYILPFVLMARGVPGSVWKKLLVWLVIAVVTLVGLLIAGFLMVQAGIMDVSSV